MNNLPDSLRHFWEVVTNVWDTGVLGYSIGDALVALLIILVFYGLRRIFKRFALAALGKWFERMGWGFGDTVLQGLGGPLQVLFLALGFFLAFEFLDLRGQFDVLGDHFIRSLIGFAIFWSLYIAVTPLSTLLKNLERVLTAEMVAWLITGLRMGVVFLGVAAILQIWGIEIGPILAGLGLFGVAVALGAQNLFKNLIGGLCILIEKRFKVGDWIEVAGVVNGTVEFIGFRSTKVRLFDLSPMFVPNQQLSDSAVKNYSRMTYRRIYWTISLEYKATLEQLKTIRQEIEDYLKTSGPFVCPPAASMFVRVDSFNTSSIDLMLYTFTKTTIWGEWLQHKEELAYAIKEIVERNGCSFAFPSQSVYLERYPDGAPEPFVPPVQRSAA
jgi:MscS family membrane protein